MTASQLIEERAELLKQIAEINAALELLSDSTRPVEIRTRRNLKNSWLPDGIQVYEDAKMQIKAYNGGHGGWITAEDAARLHVEVPADIKDGIVEFL